MVSEHLFLLPFKYTDMSKSFTTLVTISQLHLRICCHLLIRTVNHSHVQSHTGGCTTGDNLGSVFCQRTVWHRDCEGHDSNHQSSNQRGGRWISSATKTKWLWWMQMDWPPLGTVADFQQLISQKSTIKFVYFYSSNFERVKKFIQYGDSWKGLGRKAHFSITRIRRYRGQ